MTSPKRPGRKTLWVSPKAHAHVLSVQDALHKRMGRPVTQSEAVKRGMEALEREMENER